MRNPIDYKYKELLANFNKDRHLIKTMKYFDRKQIMNDFSRDLFLVHYNKKLPRKLERVQRASRFPLLNQRLLLVNELTTKTLVAAIVKDYTIKLTNTPNYEDKVAQRFNFTPQQRREFFSFHQAYSLIATVYAEPFKDLKNYQTFKQFYYYLVMYINLELSFNKFLVLEDYQPFAAKMEVQWEMIQLIASLDPMNYNKLIRKLNKWFNNKAVYRVMKEHDRFLR